MVGRGFLRYRAALPDRSKKLHPVRQHDTYAEGVLMLVVIDQALPVTACELQIAAELLV